MNFTDWIGQFVTFFSDGQFLKLGITTIALFSLVFVTWWIYRSLSDKNLFTFLERHGNVPQPTLQDRILYALRYVVLFPLYSFAGFLIVACSLYLVTRPQDVIAQEQLFFIAIALIGTIRIAAHVSEHMAEDVAKLLPLTMVAVVLLHPDQEYLGASISGIMGFIALLPLLAKYLVFLVILEVALRIAAWVAGRAGFDPGSDTED